MVDTQTLQWEIETQCNAEQAAWLLDSIALFKENGDKAEDLILRLSPPVKRKFSQDALFKDPALCHWHLWDAVRILLLEKAIECRDVESAHRILSLYFRSGDSHEKMALLKGLAHLDAEDDFVDIALSASRVNDLEIFSSLAIGNPYPARAFPELNWNQMVLKSLHLKLNINFIIGLQARLNPALTNMVADYIEELLLAGRAFPKSAWEAIDFSHLKPISHNLVAALFKTGEDSPMIKVH